MGLIIKPPIIVPYELLFKDPVGWVIRKQWLKRGEKMEANEESGRD